MEGEGEEGEGEGEGEGEAARAETDKPTETRRRREEGRAATHPRRRTWCSRSRCASRTRPARRTRWPRSRRTCLWRTPGRGRWGLERPLVGVQAAEQGLATAWHNLSVTGGQRHAGPRRGRPVVSCGGGAPCAGALQDVPAVHSSPKHSELALHATPAPLLGPGVLGWAEAAAQPRTSTSAATMAHARMAVPCRVQVATNSITHASAGAQDWCVWCCARSQRT